MGNTDFNYIVNSIIEDFFSTFGYSKFKINVIFSKDIWKSFFEIRPSLIDYFPKSLPSYNGQLVVPQYLEGAFTILIDLEYALKDMREGGYAWVGTIIHEATHAMNFIEYAVLLGVNDYDCLLNLDEHALFHIWTEFNARRQGYYFVRKYTFEDLNDESQLEYIVNKELPFQLDYYINSYSSSDSWGKLYWTSQFLGRLAVWHELFPNTFHEDFINEILGNNEWMQYLYEFLNKYRDLGEAVKHFDELRTKLKNNFIGI